jgi:hypothetical protein
MDPRAFSLSRSEGSIRVGRAELRRFIEQVDEMTDRLGAGNFSIRLKRWAGAWLLDDYEDDSGEAGEKVPRHDIELGALASEAIEIPEVLSDDLLEWLRSSDAEKAHIFFHLLGRLDHSKRWLRRIEQMGVADDGAIPFAYYFWGSVSTLARLRTDDSTSS